MIPLFKPYMPEKLPKLDYILHSGALAYGKWGHEFEKRLGEYIYNSQKYLPPIVLMRHTSWQLQRWACSQKMR